MIAGGGEGPGALHRGGRNGHDVPVPRLSKAERDRLPSTLERSEEHAQETFVRALESAEGVRGHAGDESYAHRVAFAAVKHSYEKVGDHWEPKEQSGPSDDQAATTGPGVAAPTHGGVDAHATKAHLLGLAQRLGVPGRSRMTKDELVAGIEKANRRETARAREHPDE